MKILLVNYRYFISGGPEKYMFNVKTLLEENGHEVVPFSIHSTKNVETPYSKYFVEPIGDRNAVYFNEVKKTPKSIWQLLSRSVYSFEVKRALQKEIKEEKPDIVYIIHFVNKLSPSVIRGAKQMGVPVVLRLSDFFLLCPRFDFIRNGAPCEECMTSGYYKCIKNKCVKSSLAASFIRVLSMKIHKFLKIYKDVDAFITPSFFMKEKMIQYGYDSNKITCIPTFTSTTKEDINNIEVGNYGLYFGRISEEKGVETIVKAYEKLPKNRAVIMGDDTTAEAKRLKEYISNRNITNINFIGFKTGKELENIIKNARFVMIPSIWYDNLPNTALEAFRFGKPILASNIGSIPEIVTDGYNGFLFTPSDYNRLIEFIEKLGDDNLVRTLGSNGRMFLEEHFGKEEHYRKLISLFEGLI